MFTKLLESLKVRYCLLVSLFFTFPLYAALPTPPPNDLPSGSNDIADTAANITYKDLSYALIILGVMITMGGAYSIFRAYQVGHDKQDLGHFFKYGAVSVVVLVIGLALLYYANTMLPQS